MGDPRHHKPPPIDDFEFITPKFREDVHDLLESNRLYNKAQGLKFGDPDYRIETQGELADVALRKDRRLLSRIIGSSDPKTKIQLLKRSRDLGRIRDALGMKPPVAITVPADREEMLRMIASLPARPFKAFEEYVRQVAARNTPD